MSKQTNSESASQIRLYSGPLSMFGAKAQIAMLEKGLPFELVMVPFDMARLYEPKTPRGFAHRSEAPGACAHPRGCRDFQFDTDLRVSRGSRAASAVACRARGTRLGAPTQLQSDEVYFPHIIRLMGLQDRPDDPVAVAARNAASAFYDRMEARSEDLATWPAPTASPISRSSWRSSSVIVWACRLVRISRL